MMKGSSLFQRLISHMEPWVFLPAGFLAIVFVAFSGLFTDTASSLFGSLQSGIVRHFGWFYIFTATALLIAVISLGCSRFGKIRLGGENTRPEFGNLTWFAMLLSAGMGIGIVFFGAAEPLEHFMSPPGAEGGQQDSIREAMRYTFFHWGLHPWAIYCAIALPLAYFHFRKGLPLAPRSLLYPILGDRIHGGIGHAVDTLAVLGTLFGVATSLGLGAMQINAGLGKLFGMPQGIGPQLLLITGITAMATISVVTGLHKGIRFLSQFNIGLLVFIFAFVLVFGPTVFVLEVFLDGLGYYLQKLPLTSLESNPGSHGGWQASWTLFYWSWWIAWAPFVGVFVARISKGRSIREFVFTALLVPSLGGFLWFAVIGGTGIHMELYEGADIAAQVQENHALSLYLILESLPLVPVMWLLATLLTVIFFVTSSDSGSLVNDMISSGGHRHPPRAQRLFWAITEGIVAAVLLYAGGLQALQTASLTTGLPMAVFLLVAVWGLFRSLQAEQNS
ncbi:MAG: BCCT family transporter [Oleiphilaceae bacterium]|nr:BCCT family transporter [Oleiphilaceae bacterium]